MVVFKGISDRVDKNKIFKGKPKKIKQSSQDFTPKVRVIWPWYFRYLIWGIIAMIVYILISMIIPLFTYNPILSWWRKNGGNECKDFSIYALALYRSTFIGYKLFVMTKGAQVQFKNVGQSLFILNMISIFSTQEGSLFLPINICGTIAIDPVNNKYPDNEQDWRDLLESWGMPKKSSDDTAATYMDKVAKALEKWTSKDNKQNFLYQVYHIYSTSDFLLGFMYNERVNTDNRNWTPLTFKTAVGLASETPDTHTNPSGGWWAFSTQCIELGIDPATHLYVQSSPPDVKGRQPCDKQSLVANVFRNLTTMAFIFHTPATIPLALLGAAGLTGVDFYTNKCKSSDFD